MAMLLLLLIAFAIRYAQHGPIELQLPTLSTLETLEELPNTSQCTPAKYIYYLKIHKCASSTMEAMFNRYAIRNNLTTVVFKNTHTYPDPDMLYYLNPSRDSQNYNILASHTIFAESQIKQILPKETKYVTIVRKPMEHLHSVFHYYNLCEKFELEPCDTALSTFLHNPAKYDERAQKTECCYGESNKRHYRSYTKNFMASHFGFRDHLNLANAQIADWIQYIDDRFHFIGLVDRLPESLIYLRRLLCFNIKDILFLPMRQSRPRGLDFHYYEDNLNIKYGNWSNVDYLLYSYFATKFENLIDDTDKEFKEEVQEYNALSKSVIRFCNKLCSYIQFWYATKTLSQQIGKLRAIVKTFKSITFGSFTLSGEECLFMMLNPDKLRLASIMKHSQRCEKGGCVEYVMNYLPISMIYEHVKGTPTFLYCIDDS